MELKDLLLLLGSGAAGFLVGAAWASPSRGGGGAPFGGRREEKDSGAESSEESDEEGYLHVSEEDEPIKMVLVARTDIKMGKGKMCAQCSHAAVGVCEVMSRRQAAMYKRYTHEGQKKIVVRAPSELELYVARLPTRSPAEPPNRPADTRPQPQHAPARGREAARPNDVPRLRRRPHAAGAEHAHRARRGGARVAGRPRDRRPEADVVGPRRAPPAAAKRRSQMTKNLIFCVLHQAVARRHGSCALPRPAAQDRRGRPPAPYSGFLK